MQMLRFPLLVLLCLSTTFSQTKSNKKSTAPSAPTAPITLAVDATEAPRKILHVKLTMPATANVMYPEWIPGEHSPTGPIVDFTGLHFYSGGKEVEWTRDSSNMFLFHVALPTGATTLEANYDQLLPANPAGFSSAASATANLDLLSWNQVVLYPAGAASDSVQVTASLKMPDGWKYGTALPVTSENGAQLSFKTVDLTTLVDSPVIMGSHFRRVDLGNDMGRPHYIDAAADGEPALQFPADVIAHYKNLVTESGKLFGARHYNEYHFLLTLSDNTAHFGLEHHQSSDDRVPERTLIDKDVRWLHADLLSHEMTHSWNGKYRRPAGLATGNYHDRMKGDLLWVYEGLTQYIGDILAARSGLWTNDEFRLMAAQYAAALDNTAGRTWRPLQDTATAAQTLYSAPGEWESWRRSVDYYPEGFLIWMEADTIIRQKTNGQRSLDDFCRAFHGGESTGPKLVPYTFDDVVRTLNTVAPYDWKTFLLERTTSKAPHAPLGGIENSGWRLSYTADTPKWVSDYETAEKVIDARYSLGLWMSDTGVIKDVLVGSLAYKAGIGPGMRLEAIQDRAVNPYVVHDLLKYSTESKEPLRLLVSNGGFYKTYTIDYHGGEKFPILVRDDGKPDLLEQMIKPLGTPAPEGETKQQ